METELNPNEIIDALGGTAETARLCEVNPASVSDWRKYGIPPARLMFLKLARPDVFGISSKAVKFPIPGAPIDGASVRATTGKTRRVGDYKGNTK